MRKFKIFSSEKQNKAGTIKFKTISIQSKYKKNMFHLDDVKKYYNKLLEKYDKSDIAVIGEDIAGTHTLKGYATQEHWEDHEDYWAERVEDADKYNRFLWVNFVVKI